MPIGLWTVVAWMAFVILTGVAFLIWGWRTGQFRDVEAAKYEMLKEREPEPWPARQQGGER